MYVMYSEPAEREGMADMILLANATLVIPAISCGHTESTGFVRMHNPIRCMRKCKLSSEYNAINGAEGARRKFYPIPDPLRHT